MMPPLRCNFPRFTLLFGERERERMNGRRRRDPANVRVAICPRTHLSITCPNYVSFLRAKSNSSEKEDRGWRGRVSSMSKHRFHCFSFPIIRAFDLLIDYVRKNIGRAGGGDGPPSLPPPPPPNPNFSTAKITGFFKMFRANRHLSLLHCLDLIHSLTCNVHISIRHRQENPKKTRNPHPNNLGHMKSDRRKCAKQTACNAQWDPPVNSLLSQLNQSTEYGVRG